MHANALLSRSAMWNRSAANATKAGLGEIATPGDVRMIAVDMGHATRSVVLAPVSLAGVQKIVVVSPYQRHGDIWGRVDTYSPTNGAQCHQNSISVLMANGNHLSGYHGMRKKQG